MIFVSHRAFRAYVMSLYDTCVTMVVHTINVGPRCCRVPYYILCNSRGSTGGRQMC